MTQLAAGGRPPRWSLLLLAPVLFAIVREQTMMKSSVELESSTQRPRSRIKMTLDSVRATPYYSESDGDKGVENVYDAVELVEDEEQWSDHHVETRARPAKPTDRTAREVSPSIREGSASDGSDESNGAVGGHPHEPYLNRWQRRFNSAQHEEGYLFFKHIRKAGGTSVRAFLQDAFIYHKNNRNVALFQRAKAVKAIHGNWNGTDREVHYVEQEFQTMDYKCHQVDPRWNNSLTFIILRHPIERHLSEFFFSGPGSKEWTIDKTQLISNATYTRLFVDYVVTNVPKYIKEKGKNSNQRGRFNKFFGRFYVDNFQLRSLAGCADESCLRQEEDGIEPLDLEEIHRLHPENHTYNEINPICTNYFRKDEPRGILFEVCAKKYDETQCPIGCDGPCFYPAVAWQSMTADHVARAISALERYDAVLLNEKLGDVDQSYFVSDIVGVPRDANFSMNKQLQNAGVNKTSGREKTHFYRDLLYKLHRPTLAMLEEENKLEIQLYEKAREINSKQLDQWRRETGYGEIGFQPEASIADSLVVESSHNHTAIVQSEVAVEDEAEDETLDLISKDAEPYTNRWQRRFAASESRGKKTGFLFFKHIRKAGGTTLRSYFSDVMDYHNKSRAFIFSESAQRAYDTNAMAEMKTGKAIAKVFSYKQRKVERGEIAVPTGYTVNYIEQEFEAMDWTCPSVDPRFDDSLSVIVLRHPVERQMSEFFYSGPPNKSHYRSINTTLLYVDESYTEGLANMIRDELPSWLDLDHGYPIKKKLVRASKKHTFYSPFGRYYASNHLIRSLSGCSTEDCLDKYDFREEERAIMNQQADVLKSYGEPNSTCSLFFIQREMLWDVCSRKKGGKRDSDVEECPLGCDGPCHYPALSFGDIDDLQLERAKASLRNFDAVMITDTMSEEEQSDFLSDVLGTPRDAKFALKNRTLAHNFRVEKTNQHDRSHFYRDLLNNLGLKDAAARLRTENDLDAKLFSYAQKLNAQMVNSWKHERSNQDHSHHDSAVLIVMYHKTGYVLTRHLAKSAIGMEYEARGRPHNSASGRSLDHFDEETGEQIAFGLRGNWNANFVRARSHSPITKCHPKFQLSAGAIHLQEAPDFFCSDSEVLNSMLDRQGNKTTKIVHFIRNPFSMVLSNYFYHAQSPSPEKWVHTDEPCEHNYDSGESLAESVLPILASRTRIQRHNFDEVVRICKSLYQTRESLENSTFYEHLLEMDHYDGLRLATAQMIISSSAANRNMAGGDILRMASNIIKMDSLQSNSALPQDKRELVHIMSITMEDYMQDKGNKTLQFLDFIYEDNALITEEIKLNVASSYDQMSDRTKQGAHVTQGKHADRDELRSRLMADPVFGLILNETELLVNQAVAKSTAIVD